MSAAELWAHRPVLKHRALIEAGFETSWVGEARERVGVA